MILYLHGFASGPDSTKARFFADRLAATGATVRIPDLAPDFTHLTVTSMLAIVDPLLAREPAVLFGSSLGGYLAALVAERRPERVRALVLFAPAFGFVQRWEERIGAAEVARWRAARVLPTYHYGRGREEPLAIDILDDGRRWPEEPDPPARALVFAGRRDEAVPLAAVERFVARRPDARELVVMESGHELTDVLEPMWQRTAAFLSSSAPSAGGARRAPGRAPGG
ncbi:MAG TPA: YqiA/YcfP family alpha/beta fold hydrolase [Candidatus Binatia bacterium]|nr:YqiA/YcfP family alpha/beta fold hydrolase [Candidatus Binatia bacterium]